MHTETRPGDGQSYIVTIGDHLYYDLEEMSMLIESGRCMNDDMIK